jgi:hypothetical protein
MHQATTTAGTKEDIAMLAEYFLHARDGSREKSSGAKPGDEECRTHDWQEISGN